MLIQTVAPTYDLLNDTKEYLRILDTNSDSLITSFIKASYNFAQTYTNRSLKTATYELTLANIKDGFILPKSPIQSISKIEIRDDLGAYYLYNSSKYYLYEEHGRGAIKFVELPTLVNHKLALKITFIAGYADIPVDIQNWIKYRVSTLYDGREEQVSKFVDSILDQYRIRSF